MCTCVPECGSCVLVCKMCPTSWCCSQSAIVHGEVQMAVCSGVRSSVPYVVNGLFKWGLTGDSGDSGLCLIMAVLKKEEEAAI